jgi:hypothetical protein
MKLAIWVRNPGDSKKPDYDEKITAKDNQSTEK